MSAATIACTHLDQGCHSIERSHCLSDYHSHQSKSNWSSAHGTLFGFGPTMAKTKALFILIWLAAVSGKKKAAPKLDIKLEPESTSLFEIPDWVRSLQFSYTVICCSPIYYARMMWAMILMGRKPKEKTFEVFIWTHYLKFTMYHRTALLTISK